MAGSALAGSNGWLDPSVRATGRQLKRPINAGLQLSRALAPVCFPCSAPVSSGLLADRPDLGPSMGAYELQVAPTLVVVNCHSSALYFFSLLLLHRRCRRSQPLSGRLVVAQPSSARPTYNRSATLRNSAQLFKVIICIRRLPSRPADSTNQRCSSAWRINGRSEHIARPTTGRLAPAWPYITWLTRCKCNIQPL